MRQETDALSDGSFIRKGAFFNALEVSEIVRSDEEVVLYLARVDRLAEMPPDEPNLMARKVRLKNEVLDFFNREIERSNVALNQNSFADAKNIFLARFKIEAFYALKKKGILAHGRYE